MTGSASFRREPAQLLCHAGLPSWAGFPPALNDIFRQANGDQLLRICRPRPAAAIHGAARKHFVCKFGKLFVLGRLNDVPINTIQIRAQGWGRCALARGHLLSSC